MICTNPWMKKKPSGQKAMQLSETYRKDCTPFPCGQCTNCRINASNLWSTRMNLEALDHVANTFVTLTYNNFMLPVNESLLLKDHTNFIKRLRRSYWDKNTKTHTRKIRYFMCGEYGERTRRPHYHYALFNIGEEEQERLERAWSIPFRYKGKIEYYPIGNVYIGDLNKFSARYIAGYITKGMNKKNAYTNKLLGNKKPEFQRMSTNPGLGAKRIERIAKKVGDKTGRFKEINWQGSRRHIGKYLQSKVDDILGISDEEKSKDFDRYAMEIFAEYFEEQDKYIENIITESKQVERNRLARQRIFKKRNKL